jgi:hypothetical protein
MKTLADWTGSFRDFVAVGDEVETAIVEHFRDSVPPVRNGYAVMQAGEAVNTVNGRHTYMTFVRVSPVGWIYVGCCHAGETSEPSPLAQPA